MYLYVLAAILFLLLAYYTYTLQVSTRNMPPGPFEVPLLGAIPAIWLRKPIFSASKLRPWEYMDMLFKEYGDLVSYRMFNIQTISISSYELLQEVAEMEEFSCKFAHELYTYPYTFGKEMGLAFVYSKPLWTEMRKFTVRTLREFGFGKQYSMHGVISKEVGILMADFKKTMKSTGGIVKFRTTFSLPVLNVLWCMVAGFRYEHDDPRMQKLLSAVYNMSKSATLGDPAEAVVPLIRKFAPWLFKNYQSQKSETYNSMHEHSKQIIEERKEQGFYLSEPQSYIDVFLKKIHETKNDKNTFYTEQQLQGMLADLILVGSLTLNATLNYAVLFLLRNPEVQKKCHQEIDSVVSRGMGPTVDDIQKMPYFQAFLLEVHRCANVVPNPIPRIVPKDWKLRGYHIPKGTVVFSNHYSVNFDERIWGDAQVFRPERFINDKGEFEHDPRVTVFGFGKRKCIGINLVNNIYPLFMASLLQNFDFSVVPHSEPPTLEPVIGINLSPKEFTAQLVIRNMS